MHPMRLWPVWVSLLLGLGMLIALAVTWEDVRASQAVLGAGGLAASIMLLVVTWLYVLANQEMVELLRRQESDSQRVELLFGLALEEGHLVLWVANLGRAHFMIARAQIRTPAGRIEEYHLHLVVQAGRVERSIVPEDALARADIQGDVDVQLFYRGAKDAQPNAAKGGPLAFNLLIAHGVIESVREGFRDGRPVKCPKCKKQDNILMSSEGLGNEDDAYERQQLMQVELSRTCPQHQSQWRVE